jgi:hypothetical protein
MTDISYTKHPPTQAAGERCQILAEAGPPVVVVTPAFPFDPRGFPRAR